MSEVLNKLWELLSGLCVAGWELISSLGMWIGGWMCQLHNTAPRLEGLLIGVLLAWLLLRREKHPILRVLSSPLKLVIDILDLAWEQSVAVVSDCWGTARSWVSGVWKWCWSKVTSVWNLFKGWTTGIFGWFVGKLKSIKSILSKKSSKDNK